MLGNFIIMFDIKLVLVRRFVCVVCVLFVFICDVINVDRVDICLDFFFSVLSCFWNNMVFKFLRWFFNVVFLLLLKKNLVFVRWGWIIFLLLEIIWDVLWFLIFVINKKVFESVLLLFSSGIYFWLFFMV